MRVKSSAFWLPFSDLDLPSTEAPFETISLEVIDSTLCVDTVREKLTIRFASVTSAPPFGIGFTSCFELTLMPQDDSWWVFFPKNLKFLLLWQLLPP